MIKLQVIYCLAYSSVSYFLTAQPADASRFFMFVLVCCLVSISAEALGLVFGTLVNPVVGTKVKIQQKIYLKNKKTVNVLGIFTSIVFIGKLTEDKSS